MNYSKRITIKLPKLDAYEAYVVAGICETICKALWFHHGNQMSEIMMQSESAAPKPVNEHWSGETSSPEEFETLF